MYKAQRESVRRREECEQAEAYIAYTVIAVIIGLTLAHLIWSFNAL